MADFSIKCQQKIEILKLLYSFSLQNLTRKRGQKGKVASASFMHNSFHSHQRHSSCHSETGTFKYALKRLLLNYSASRYKKLVFRGFAETLLSKIKSQKVQRSSLECSVLLIQNAEHFIQFPSRNKK